MAGAEAMVVALVAMFAIRIAFGVITLPELISDTIILVIPATVFSTTLDVLRTAAKPLLIVILLAGQIAVGSLIGSFIASATTFFSDTDSRRILRPTLTVAAVVLILTLAVAMPALGVGFLGVYTTAGAPLTVAGYALGYATYVVAFAWLYPRLSAEPATPDSSPRVTRRAILRPVGVGLLVFLGASAGLKWVGTLSLGKPRVAQIPPPITPVSDFYVVSKNLLGTSVDMGRWKVNVIGSGSHVSQPDLQEFMAMPAMELTTTLTCISNLIGGDLIGTARWTGVRLRDVIGVPTPGESIQSVVFTGWDDYTDSIPIDRALADTTLLAYAMNGQPLPPEHGYPLRLIVPGLYGIKNVKWIKGIEVASHGTVGYWQARGWSDLARVQTESQIDLPLDGASLVVGPIAIGGIAFAGDRGITQVELSADNGNTWVATALTQPVGPLTWTAWSTTWQPASGGNYQLVVRATDGNRSVQGSAESPPLPDGATGLHRITVRVS